jgi:MerR family transcriptional regulator, repressor of the yfmOP operon
MTTTTPPPVAAAARLRIGEVAELTGVTPRTIRYYEEIGLLPGAADRPQGQHRCYTQADVERLTEIVRLRNLLGVSLEQLSKLIEAEDARAELRRAYQTAKEPGARRQILEQALELIENQLELVRERRGELEKLEGELRERRRTLHARLRENS